MVATRFDTWKPIAEDDVALRTALRLTLLVTLLALPGCAPAPAPSDGDLEAVRDLLP